MRRLAALPLALLLACSNAGPEEKSMDEKLKKLTPLQLEVPMIKRVHMASRNGLVLRVW